MRRPKSERVNRVLDRAALVGAALLLIVAGGSAFLFADKYHVSRAWVFAAWSAIFFFLIIGWGYRRRFCEPSFISFFLIWTILHSAVFLLVLGYLGFLYYLPIMVL